MARDSELSNEFTPRCFYGILSSSNPFQSYSSIHSYAIVIPGLCYHFASNHAKHFYVIPPTSLSFKAK
jgi:hypothetical protein